MNILVCSGTELGQLEGTHLVPLSISLLSRTREENTMQELMDKDREIAYQFPSLAEQIQLHS